MIQRRKSGCSGRKEIAREVKTNVRHSTRKSKVLTWHCEDRVYPLLTNQAGRNSNRFLFGPSLGIQRNQQTPPNICLILFPFPGERGPCLVIMHNELNPRKNTTERTQLFFPDNGFMRRSSPSTSWHRNWIPASMLALCDSRPCASPCPEVCRYGVARRCHRRRQYSSP